MFIVFNVRRIINIVVFVGVCRGKFILLCKVMLIVVIIFVKVVFLGKGWCLFWMVLSVFLVYSSISRVRIKVFMILNLMLNCRYLLCVWL